MKTIKLKAILAALIALVMLCFAACQAPAAVPEPTAAPVATAVPAPEPTQAPVAEPTPEPTPEPKQYLDHTGYHADVMFGDMKYTEFDLEAYRLKVEAFCALLETEGNFEAIKASFEENYKLCEQADTVATLASTLYNLDYKNDARSEDSDKSLEIDIEANDIFRTSVAAALNSELYGEEFTAYLGDARAENYKDYEPMKKELKDLYNEQTKLEKEYDKLAAEEMSGTVDGKTMTTDDVYDKLSGAERERALQEVYKTANEKQGKLLIKMRDVRNKIAKLEGYDNYVEFCYKEIYGRDYDPDAALAFAAVAKKYLKSLPGQYTKMAYSYYECNDACTAKSADEVVALVGDCVEALNSELALSYSYMVDHKLVDITDNGKKLQNMGYTTSFSSYGAPFIYNAPSGDMFDISTMIHEFGHYNNAYYTNEPDNVTYSSSYDLCEIHSQGLEALFSQYYDDIYPGCSDYARRVLIYFLSSSIVEGCKYDQLQQEFYLDNLSLDEMNARYKELCEEYGKSYPNDLTYDRTWIDVPHTFTSPMYYISYATSALSSLDIYNMACENPDRALDEYMKLLAYHDVNVGYLEVLDKAGFGNFTDESYVENVLSTVMEHVKTLKDPTK